MSGCAKCGVTLGMRAAGPFVTILRLLQPPKQFKGPEPLPGQHLTHYSVHLGPGYPGHLPPQVSRAAE